MELDFTSVCAESCNERCSARYVAASCNGSSHSRTVREFIVNPSFERTNRTGLGTMSDAMARLANASNAIKSRCLNFIRFSV